MDVTVLAMLSVLSGAQQTPAVTHQQTAACFYQTEMPAGMNKICYYNCLSGPVAITINALKMCPLQING